MLQGSGKRAKMPFHDSMIPNPAPIHASLSGICLCRYICVSLVHLSTPETLVSYESSPGLGCSGELLLGGLASVQRSAR